MPVIRLGTALKSLKRSPIAAGTTRVLFGKPVSPLFNPATRANKLPMHALVGLPPAATSAAALAWLPLPWAKLRTTAILCASLPSIGK